MVRRRVGSEIGAIIIGGLILLVGGYHLLVNWFGLELPELDWDKIWPLGLVALGLAIVLGAWSRMGRGGQGPQGV